MWLHFISVGSGGNNHAIEHYEQTKYPLAVKLGTITPDGADVYSYEENDMVEDPHLTQHLKHFGIDIASMTKVRSGGRTRSSNHELNMYHKLLMLDCTLCFKKTTTFEWLFLMF